MLEGREGGRVSRQETPLSKPINNVVTTSILHSDSHHLVTMQCCDCWSNRSAVWCYMPLNLIYFIISKIIKILDLILDIKYH